MTQPECEVSTLEVPPLEEIAEEGFGLFAVADTSTERLSLAGDLDYIPYSKVLGYFKKKKGGLLYLARMLPFIKRDVRIDENTEIFYFDRIAFDLLKERFREERREKASEGKRRKKTKERTRGERRESRGEDGQKEFAEDSGDKFSQYVRIDGDAYVPFSEARTRIERIFGCDPYQSAVRTWSRNSDLKIVEGDGIRTMFVKLSSYLAIEDGLRNHQQ